MSRESMTVEKRDASGKSPVARRLRKEGRVPGVIYGAGNQYSFSVDSLELAAVIRHGATLVDVELDGSKHLTVIKEYQLHPVRGDMVHIDLQEVTMDQMVKTVTQISLVGDCPGVKAGGVLTQGTRELNIESAAGSIPEFVEVDISTLELGDTRILRDLPPVANVEFLDDPGQMVVAVSIPRGAKGMKTDAASVAAEEAEAAAAAGGAAAGDSSDEG